MSLEHELLTQRFRRTRELESLGQRPYGARFDFSHTVPQIWAGYSEKTAEELEAGDGLGRSRGAADPEVRRARTRTTRDTAGRARGRCAAACLPAPDGHAPQAALAHHRARSLP